MFRPGGRQFGEEYSRAVILFDPLGVRQLQVRFEQVQVNVAGVVDQGCSALFRPSADDGRDVRRRGATLQLLPIRGAATSTRYAIVTTTGGSIDNSNLFSNLIPTTPGNAPGWSTGNVAGSSSYRSVRHLSLPVRFAAGTYQATPFPNDQSLRLLGARTICTSSGRTPGSRARQHLGPSPLFRCSIDWADPCAWEFWTCPPAGIEQPSHHLYFHKIRQAYRGHFVPVACRGGYWRVGIIQRVTRVY